MWGKAERVPLEGGNKVFIGSLRSVLERNSPEVVRPEDLCEGSGKMNVIRTSSIL